MSICRRDQAKEMQRKVFEEIAKRQQKLLTASNGEEVIRLLFRVTLNEKNTSESFERDRRMNCISRSLLLLISFVNSL